MIFTLQVQVKYKVQGCETSGKEFGRQRRCRKRRKQYQPDGFCWCGWQYSYNCDRSCVEFSCCCGGCCCCNCGCRRCCTAADSTTATATGLCNQPYAPAVRVVSSHATTTFYVGVAASSFATIRPISSAIVPSYVQRKLDDESYYR